MKKFTPIVIIVLVLVALAGMYKFNYLASQEGYDVDGNKIESVEEEKSFEIIEPLGVSCQSDADCETPHHYAVRSICPYDSVCIENTCTVICPHPFTGAKVEPPEPDFEGEANPDMMTLDMTTWNWIRTTYNNDTEVTPDTDGVFTIDFKEDGTVSIGTDCNSMGGNYEVNENQLTFGPLFSTKMYCADSQEQEFSQMLEEVQSYHFTSRGELILDLKFDTGVVVFR